MDAPIHQSSPSLGHSIIDWLLHIICLIEPSPSPPSRSAPLVSSPSVLLSRFNGPLSLAPNCCNHLWNDWIKRKRASLMRNSSGPNFQSKRTLKTFNYKLFQENSGPAALIFLPDMNIYGLGILSVVCPGSSRPVPSDHLKPTPWESPLHVS